MHKEFDINLANISKIEGHTDLDIHVKNGKVVSCELKINESKRFYTNAVVGMSYQEGPIRMSRICGTCSPAHIGAACAGIEEAVGIKLSKQAKIMRELLIMGNNVRDHAMHLYFFCLPDIFGKDSVLDLGAEYNELIHKALHVKEAGNALCTLIGGRSIHPPFAHVGGFLMVPKTEDVVKVINEMKEAREYSVEFLEYFYNHDLSFVRSGESNFVALCGNDFSYTTGVIKTSSGKKISEKEFREHLERVVLPYCDATAFEFDFKDYMVGALARLNLNKDSLNVKTKKDCAKYLAEFPSKDIFRNNLAQGIEIVHCFDKAIEILNSYKFKHENVPEAKVHSDSVGVGVVEAPRGTLYHKYSVDKFGKIISSEIIIPTSQNIIHIQESITQYVNQLISEGVGKKEISMFIERMIRAYDPCMSCATHFLQVNWKEIH